MNFLCNEYKILNPKFKAMADELKVGDVVKIKITNTISPEMVIDEEINKDEVFCVWYVQSVLEFKKHRFAKTSLIKIR